MALASSSLESSVRSWRTAFLTLRDETLASPPPSSVVRLLDDLMFSQSGVLVAAAPNLPSDEVICDVLFLLELARNVYDSEGFKDSRSFPQLAHLIHGVSKIVYVNSSSSSFPLILNSLENIVETCLEQSKRKHVSIGNADIARAMKEYLDTIRCLFSTSLKTSLLSGNKQLLRFLLNVIASLQTESIYSRHLSVKQRGSGQNSLWEVQTVAFNMICEVYSGTGSSLPTDVWQSTIEVIRKVLDVMTSKSSLVEDHSMARFYTSLLNCLHSAIVDPKGSLSDHVAGFVAALKLFFHYGLGNNTRVLISVDASKKNVTSTSINPNLEGSSRSNSGPYRPPHLRKKNMKNLKIKDEEPMSSSENETPAAYLTSSDSDYSDSDSSGRDICDIQFAKTRLAAMICLQDLCRVEPKSITTQWTMLLPSSDVLQPRRYEATVMSCLLFDPYLKARIASAATIRAMLEGSTSAFLQVAEFKESAKCGSFTALSSSLGQILMQLHSGILYQMKCERNSALLALLFKILSLLVSSTPYSRMPPQLLPTVISSVRARIEEGFMYQSDQNSLLAATINCLTIALSTSPSSDQLKDMLLMDVSKGSQSGSGILSALFRYSEPVISPLISYEALQALKAVAHNYPSIAISCWEKVSSLVYRYLSASPEVSSRSWRDNIGNSGELGEKIITNAIKVLDEYLRAISGFKGTEDLSNDKLLDDPFTSDHIKIKTISSAPTHSSDCHPVFKNDLEKCEFGSEQWLEAIIRHMPLICSHPSPVVRAASVTCFAGMTSSVFFSLPKEKQDFVLTTCISAAMCDEVPSVRSAACRAIGVISCFPRIFLSTRILDKFVDAAECSTHNSIVSVRITASWALANICDSLCDRDDAHTSEGDFVGSKVSSQLISLLIDCALRLMKDNDKIKANAVRALGNISRFVRFTSQSGSYQPTFRDLHLLERMVQAFLSCITTGNVKVQWNACHALSNLFLNETVKLQEMNWAPSVYSILLLLLRDSSNFKIRIQAAAALAVPATVNDYGSSYYDILQGVEHILENLSSDQISTPSNYKYRVALEKQLTSTMLHVLGLASTTDHRAIQEFLVKKASFLEEWLIALSSTLEETSDQFEGEDNSYVNRKRDVISTAIQSLVQVYEGSSDTAIARRFDKLATKVL